MKIEIDLVTYFKNTLFANDLEKACRFAEIAHQDQTREDGITPYIQHLKMVCDIASRQYRVTCVQSSSVMFDPLIALTIQVVSLLHDTVEDNSEITIEMIREIFNDRIANLVGELTLEPIPTSIPSNDRQAYKTNQLIEKAKSKSMSPVACLIKISDQIANLTDAMNSDWTLLRIRKYAMQSAKIIDAMPRANLIEGARREFATVFMRAMLMTETTEDAEFTGRKMNNGGWKSATGFVDKNGWKQG